MGTERRQRGNNNLLIITNNVIINAVDKKLISPMGKCRDMTLFDMGDGIVLVRIKNRVCFIMDVEDVHTIMAMDVHVQRYGVPKGNGRQGYRCPR